MSSPCVPSPLSLTPIGWVSSVYKEKFGTPRQSGVVASAWGTLHFYPPYDREEAFRGLDEFTHLWIIGHFHQVPAKEQQQFRPMIRPPKLGGNHKVGVFSSRSPFRPNALSLSVVRLEAVQRHEKTCTIDVSGLDLIDGTPFFDLKPYLPYAESLPMASGGYSVPPEAKYHVQPSPFQKELTAQEWQTLQETLCAQPAPGYHDQEGREYAMTFLNYNVKWICRGDQIILSDLKKKD